ncbi:MAG: hypothetical protein ABJP34_12780 [Erythrobacter sp.]
MAALLAFGACAQSPAVSAASGAPSNAFSNAEFIEMRPNERAWFRAAVRKYMALFGGCPRVEIPEDKPMMEVLRARQAGIWAKYQMSPLRFDFNAAVLDANIMNMNRMATIRCASPNREPTDIDRRSSKALIKEANAVIDEIEAAAKIALKGLK